MRSGNILFKIYTRAIEAASAQDDLWVKKNTSTRSGAVVGHPFSWDAALDKQDLNASYQPGGNTLGVFQVTLIRAKLSNLNHPQKCP